MQTSNSSLKRKTIFRTLFISTLSMFILQTALAIPPSSSYAPGETLTPTCLPGTSNCTVRAYAVSGANSDITSLSAISTPLTVLQGGTGLSSISPYSILYSSATNTVSALAVGTAGQVLKISGGVPVWGTDLTGGTSYTSGNGITFSTSSVISVNEAQLTLANLGGTLGATKGGTGFTSYTIGDIVYASATNTLSKLSPGINGLVLTLVGGLPSWTTVSASGTSYTAGNGITFSTSSVISVNESQLTLANLSGLLPVSKGGTGTSTIFTTGSIIFAGASGVFNQNNAGLSWDNTNSKLSVVGTIAGTHLKGLGSTPTISAGSGAGTGGLTAPVVSVSGTDSAGEITVTTGNGVLSLGSTVMTLSFASAYSQAPHVIFSPANTATALLSGVTNLFVSSTASNFGFTSGSAALTALTTYKWSYQVIE